LISSPKADYQKSSTSMFPAMPAADLTNVRHPPAYNLAQVFSLLVLVRESNP
jgi:hypothetical protein